MKALRACISLVAAITVMSALSACGGGGSSSGGTPTVTYSIMGIVSGAPQGTTVDLAGAKVASTTTNAIGFYQFTGLSSGSYTVTPSRMGYAFSPASKSVTISSGNSVNTDFTVTNAYAISGIVSGAPQGVSIALSGDAVTTATTNSLGYYEFPGLLNGSYTVTPSMPGYTLSPASIPVTISSTNVMDRNFSVVFGIAGSVKTGTGTGVAGATITLVNSSGAVTTRTTDANGDYSALGLDPGAYTISATLAGYSMNPINQKATVTCDMRTGIDFSATAGTTYSILGTVSSLTYVVPDGITMTLSGDNSGYVVSSPGGTYMITGLSNGTYTITPSKFSYIFSSSCSTTINNANSSCDFTITDRRSFPAAMPPPNCVELSGAISGPASNASTISILYRSYTLSTTVTSDISGNYLKSVPSGSYVITPLNNGYTFTPPRICGAVSTCNSMSPTVVPNNDFTSQ